MLKFHKLADEVTSHYIRTCQFGKVFLQKGHSFLDGCSHLPCTQACDKTRLKWSRIILMGVISLLNEEPL